MTSLRAFRQARNEVDEYIDKLDPVKLSKERNNREVSRYDDWYSRTFRKDQERLKDFVNLQKFYRRRRTEVMSYSRNKLMTIDYPNYQQEMKYRGNN